MIGILSGTTRPPTMSAMVNTSVSHLPIVTTVSSATEPMNGSFTDIVPQSLLLKTQNVPTSMETAFSGHLTPGAATFHSLNALISVRALKVAIITRGDRGREHLFAWGAPL
jgi:hypothetical protein